MPTASGSAISRVERRHTAISFDGVPCPSLPGNACDLLERTRSRATGNSVEQAAADGRLRHAVGYLRLAEFFTPPRSAAKVERYRRFRALFGAAFSGGGLIRNAIPYAGASLPAYWLPAAGERTSGAAVLIHGGSTH